MPVIANRRSTPTFLESFTPHAHLSQAAGRGSSPVTSLSSTVGQFNSQASYANITEQIKHFTYWNYVAGDLICNRASAVFPTLSYKAKAATPTVDSGIQSAVSDDDRVWIRQNYGWLQSAQEDLQPLPEAHPLVELFENPNPDDTWNEFAYEHFMFFFIAAKSYWWVIPNGLGKPAQMAVIPPQWVRPDYDRNGMLYQYVITPDGCTSFTIPADQVIESKKKSPWNKRDGYSAMAAAPKWTTNTESIEASRFHSFRNGANPDLLIKLGERYTDPDDEVITRIKEKFMRRASSVTRSGEPQVVPPGIEIEKWSNSPREMDYAASGDQSRDNNLALHSTPKTLAGITTEVNRANVDASEAVFCSGKINPLLRGFAGTLTWLARRFDPRICVWFPDMTPKDAAQELLEDQADFAMGALDPDERRQKRGRKPKGEPAYQSGYIAAGLHPLAEELNQPEPGIDPLTGLPIEDPSVDPNDPNADGEANTEGDDGDTEDPKAGDKGASKDNKPEKSVAKPGTKKPTAKKSSTQQSGFTHADFDSFHGDNPFNS